LPGWGKAANREWQRSTRSVGHADLSSCRWPACFQADTTWSNQSRQASRCQCCLHACASQSNSICNGSAAAGDDKSDLGSAAAAGADWSGARGSAATWWSHSWGARGSAATWWSDSWGASDWAGDRGSAAAKDDHRSASPRDTVHTNEVATSPRSRGPKVHRSTPPMVIPRTSASRGTSPMSRPKLYVVHKVVLVMESCCE
jgi:hypothetical protein